MTERAGIKMRDISKRTTIPKRSKTASHARGSSAPTELCGLSATEAVGLMRQRRPQYARDKQERARLCLAAILARRHDYPGRRSPFDRRGRMFIRQRPY
jgi:hypothetical protein